MSANSLHAQGMEGFAALLDALLEGFQVIDTTYCYRYVNAAAASHGHTTRSALIGRTMMEAFPGIEQTPMFERLARTMTTRVSDVFENEFTYPDGTSAYFELRFEPVPQGVCILSIDITARKRAEAAERVEAEEREVRERLESVGRLAAGIAHDFNNLLSVILGLGEHALKRETSPTREDVEGMMEAAQRSAELTHQLLAYGRRQVLRKRIVDPVALVRGLEVLLSRTLGGHVELVVRVAPPVGLIDVDASKLEQVVMNLVLNARDAMPEGGRITVGLSTIERIDVGAGKPTGLASGAYVRLSVTDTGMGMSAATRARIFEPFFTTKARGKGTGLGLATVHGVVKQSGGEIWVQSEPGRGTTFEIFFPVTTRTSDTEDATPMQTTATRPSGKATILVAEDDQKLRKLTAFSLEAAGHTVLLAESGEEALTHVRSRDAIDMLVTDVMMPGMRGTDLIVAARKLRPGLRIICTSGHERSELDVALERDVVFLVKPFLPSVLVAEVAALLGQAT
jgi:two-component system cell cycle sensor histidine kinase/response regulator CckA